VAYRDVDLRMKIVVYRQVVAIGGLLGVFFMLGGAQSKDWIAVVAGSAILALTVLYYRGILQRFMFVCWCTIFKKWQR